MKIKANSSFFFKLTNYHILCFPFVAKHKLKFYISYIDYGICDLQLEFGLFNYSKLCGLVVYMGSSTETFAFQVYEILKIDHEFLQFF